MNTTTIVPFDVTQASQLALAMKQLIVQMMNDKVLVEGVHYGTIPGTNKPTLYKPGAEYLASAHKLNNTFYPLTVIEDWEHGFFFYRYECRLTHRETGELYGTGVGSCNSMEAKYRWRWVSEEQLPAGFDVNELERKDGRKTLSEFGFAIDKAETGGQYGKPADYWQVFKDAIANGTAKAIQKKTSKGAEYAAYEISVGSTSYRIPNNEPYDLVNTLDKMAQKRALIAAALIATNASEFFTQDLEDFIQSPVISVADEIPVTSNGLDELSLKELHIATPRADNRHQGRTPASAPETPQTGAQGENPAILKTSPVGEMTIKRKDANSKPYAVIAGVTFFSGELLRAAGFDMTSSEWKTPGRYPFPDGVKVVVGYHMDGDYKVPASVEIVD